MYIIRIIRGLYRRLLLFAGNCKLISYKLQFRDARWGKNVQFYGCGCMRLSGETIIGNNITFNNNTRFNFAGIKSCCSIYVNPEAKLTIGNNSGFSGCAIYCSTNISIGENCLFGTGVSIWDTDFHQINYKDRLNNNIDAVKSKPIKIGNNVFVGAHSIILKGVTIGDGCVVGAGSVVTKDLPAYSLAAGNPAVIQRKLET